MKAISADPKVFILAAGGSVNAPKVLGNPIVTKKGAVCSQTFLYAKFKSNNECDNFAAYFKTRVFRFLVSAMKITQHAQKGAYRFASTQDFTEPWIDEKLYAKYGITESEQKFIESMIKPME